MYGIPLPHGQSLQLTALSGPLQKMLSKPPVAREVIVKPSAPVAKPATACHWARLSQFDLDTVRPVNQSVAGYRF